MSRSRQTTRASDVHVSKKSKSGSSEKHRHHKAKESSSSDKSKKHGKRPPTRVPVLIQANPSSEPVPIPEKSKKLTVSRRSSSKPDSEKGTGGIKKPHRWRSGTVALRNIKKHQKECKPIIQNAPFHRFIRGIAADHSDDCRFSCNSFTMLQEATETFMVRWMDDSNDIANTIDKKQRLARKHLKIVFKQRYGNRF